MSATNRNQNSANQNAAGENVPLTAITLTQTDEGNVTNQETKNGADSMARGNRKDTNDNSEDQIYNPETVLTNTQLDDVPDGFNIYRNKKTLTQGLMDIALFSANANQLRYILEHASHSPYFYITISFIVISLILQVGVGFVLLISTQYKLSVAGQRQSAYKCGNYVVGGIFLITIVNVFIAAFGGPAVAFPPAVPIPANNTGGT